jgi:hypothetical protein
MNILNLPAVVFVPFEWDGQRWVKRDDLPRFFEPKDAIDYINDHQEISTRNGKPVPLEWVEHSEHEYVMEYVRGIGTRKT